LGRDRIGLKTTGQRRSPSSSQTFIAENSFAGGGFFCRASRHILKLLTDTVASITRKKMAGDGPLRSGWQMADEGLHLARSGGDVGRLFDHRRVSSVAKFKVYS
jgi:hypothetical protein